MLALQVGDIIDIVAPSSAPKNSSWLEGVEILKQWGLKPRYPKNIIKPCLYHAQQNHKRELFLKKAFSSSSKAVWAVRGGYGLQKIMPEFLKAKKYKKIWIGYSDATAMHIYLNGKCKQETWHAPFLCELPHLPKTQLNHLRKLLFGETKTISFPRLKYFGKASCDIIKSPIIGGNLSLLSTSLACPWFPKSLNSSFLFLEDVGEEAYRIDRYLHQLFLSGVAQKIKVLLLGSFHPVQQKDIMDKIFKPFIKKFNLLVVTGLPCGHQSKNHALPFLKKAELCFLKSHKARLKIHL